MSAFTEHYVPRRLPQCSEIRLPDGPLAVHRWPGPAQGPVTLLLHGFLDTGATWQFMVDELPGERALWAPDWRGFGRSPSTGSPYWFPQYFAELDALLDQLSPGQPANLVGHSMGGHIALMYAGVRPERVARVLSLDGFGLRRTVPEDAIGRYREWLDALREPPEPLRDYESMDVFTRVLRARHPHLTPARAAFVAQAWTRELPGGRVTVAMDPLRKLPNPVSFRREEMEACWAAIRCPALLVLAGENDYSRSLGGDGTAAALDRYLPGRVVTLPSRTHMLHHQRPAAVAAWVHAFLEDQPLPDVSHLE
jgi:pimeloyl-ACP methyl ester carboxylesterase